MKRRKKNEYGLQWTKKTFIVMVICIVLLLLCLGVSFQHVVTTIRHYRTNMHTSILAQTKLDAEIVKNNLESDISVIKASAEQFQVAENSITSISDDIIYKMLYGVRANSSLERLVLLLNDGRVVSSEKYSTMSGFEKLVPRKDPGDTVWVQRCTYDFGDGMASYCITVPVRRDGVLLGYLLGFNTTKNLMKGTETDTYSNISRSYVLDDKGRIMAVGHTNQMTIIKSDDFYQGVRDSFTKTADADIAEETFRKQFALGNTGILSYETDDDKLYMYYTPISGNDGWVFLNTVSENSVTELTRGLALATVTSIALILLIMALISIIIWRFIVDEQAEMMKLAYEDSLTHAPNERYFVAETTKLLKEYHEVAYRMVSFDLMNFRYLNESYGHQKADDVLRTIVTVCEKELGTRETFARIGADKFVVLLVDDGRTEDRLRRVEAQISGIAQEHSINYPIKLKCGFYEVVNHKEAVNAMIDKANLARKSIKPQGKELTSIYRDELMEETRRIEFIESKMEYALMNGEFVPYLQPKWDMKRNEIIASEALVRWVHSNGDVMPPGDFISIFEQNGFIEKVDFYMLERICKYLRQMIDEGKKVYPVSINQSRFLLHDPNYTANVQQILLKYKIPKGLIELELTETVFFQERERMIEVMKELKNLNLDILIDDFGSGYSSLNLLRDIPFDALKIDGAFLNQTNVNEAGKFILRKVVEMAEGLGVRVICECVETKMQADMLLEIGCFYAQGYLYSKPIPLHEFIRRYNE